MKPPFSLRFQGFTSYDRLVIRRRSPFPEHTLLAAGFFALILAVSGAFSRATQPVDSLIAALADPDAQVRENAQDQLTKIGVDARPALVTASRCDDVAIASAASRVLLA